jgi:cytochrome c553
MLAALWLLLGAAAAQAQARAGVPDTMAQRALACTGCHGDQGRSRPDGYVPRLAGKPAGYLFAQLQAFRDGRRKNTAMAAQLAALDDRMLSALAEHFAGLTLPYPPPTARMNDGPGAERARQLVWAGDAALRIPACSGCHGPALTGVAPGVPGLVGLPADYLVSQLGGWRTGHRVARSPDCMAQIARQLPAADVALLARWIASQPVPTPSVPAAQAPGPWPLACGGLSP